MSGYVHPDCVGCEQLQLGQCRVEMKIERTGRANAAERIAAFEKAGCNKLAAGKAIYREQRFAADVRQARREGRIR